MPMTATDSSRPRLWLAMGGLLAVPVLGFTLAVVWSSEERAERGHEAASEPAGADDPEPDPALQPRQAEALEPPQRRPPMAAREPAGEAEPGMAESVPAETTDENDEPASAEALIDEARRLDRTDPERSRELLRQALIEDPDNVVALERLSGKLLVDEDYQEARRLAERCRTLSDNPMCAKTANLAATDSEDIEKLGAAAETCLAKTPNHVNCLSWMVGYHLANGRMTDAAVYAGRLTQTAPQAPETLSARGRVKALGGEYGDARQLFEWACERDDPHACLRLDILKSEGW